MKLYCYGTGTFLFDAWVGQTGHSVANGTTAMFLRNRVAHTLSRANGLRHSLRAST